MPEDRRLAAIMFTDIVGYTALMGRDEDQAFKILRKNREIQRPIIEKYKGEWLKEMGDGILASFPSSSDAVKCANEIQFECKKAKIGLRIGIHEGEVVFEGNDVLGDGVNVASRLEELSDEGCITISGAVYRDIKNKAGIITEYIDETQLKNVDEPIKIYKVHLQESKKENPIEYPDSIDSKTSIAVLPFRNESDEKGTQYFANGIMEAILNHLSKISDLRVPSRTSSEKYRDSKLSARTIAYELDVSYLLEGSVQKYGDSVRICAQLIKAKTDDHVWSDIYDKDYSDLLNIQSEIAQKVGEELHAIITPEERKLIKQIPTSDLNAYDYYLRAKDFHVRYFVSHKNSDLESAVSLYNEALDLDKSFALAYAWLGNTFLEEKWLDGYIKPDYSLKAIEYFNKAIELNQYLPEAFTFRGLYYHEKGDPNNAIKDLNKSIALNPNFASAYFWLGEVYYENRDYINALDMYKKAEKLEKGNELPWIYSGISLLYNSIGELEKSEFYWKRSLQIQPDFLNGIRGLCWLAEQQGKDEEQLSIAEKYSKLYPNENTFNELMARAYVDLGRYEEAEKYYRKWLKKGGYFLNVMHRYAYVLWMNNKKDEANKYFERQLQHCTESLVRNKIYSKNAMYDLAAIYAFQSNRKEAYKWLKKYAETGFNIGLHIFIYFDQLFENLWHEEEFNAIIREQERKFEKIRIQINQLDKETVS